MSAVLPRPVIRPVIYGLALITMMLASSACSEPPRQSPSASDGPTHLVHVVSHGWHTGLVIHAEDIRERLPGIAGRFPDTPYLEFGWGDEEFYQAEEITSGLALHSILVPTDTVMHVVAVTRSPYIYFAGSEVESLCLQRADYLALLDHITSGFDRDAEGNIIATTRGIYGDSQFYAGGGRYHLFNTCNKWTAEALAAAGVDIWPAASLTAGSVINSVEQWNAGEVQVSCPDWDKRNGKVE